MIKNPRLRLKVILYKKQLILLSLLLMISMNAISGELNQIQVAKFKSKLLPDPSDGGGSAGFGGLTLDGSRATIRASGDSGSGLVYIYEKVNNEWEKTAEISPENGYLFGSIILSGDTLFIRSSSKQSQNSVVAFVDVFQYQNGIWKQKQKITIQDKKNNALSLWNMSLFGDQLFISLIDNRFNNVTQIRVFELLDDNWQQAQNISPNHIDDEANFGYALALVGDQLLIGAPGQNSFTGVVYVFERVNDQWMEVSVLAPKELPVRAAFGASLHHNQNGLFVGAITQDQGSEEFTGAVYWLSFKQDEWEYKDILQPSIPMSFSLFGTKIESEGSKLYVSTDKFLNSNGIEDSAIHVFDLINIENQPEVISIDETSYKRNFANSFKVDSGRMIVNAPSYRNINPKSIGKAYILNLDNLTDVEAEMVAPEAAVDANFGSHIIASGDWLMVDRAFRSENNQTWIDGVEIFKKTSEGWVKTQQIKNLSDDNTVHWYTKTMDNGLAIFLKSKLINSEYIDSYDLYKLDGTEWDYLHTLSPYDGLEDIGFGYDLDINQNYIAVGAPGHPPSGEVYGAIYLFEYDGAFLINRGKVLAEDPVQYGAFGAKVILSGQFLSTSTSIRYPAGFDTRGEYEVHVYKKVGNQWSYHQKIESFTEYHYDIGRVMEMTPEWLLLYEWSNSEEPYGLIRVFNLNQGIWQEQTPLLQLQNDNSSIDGKGISIQDNMFVLGQQFGFVNMYNYKNSVWQHVQQIFDTANPNTAIQAVFADESLLISAPKDSTIGRGAGAVNVFDLVDDIIFSDGLEVN